MAELVTELALADTLTWLLDVAAVVAALEADVEDARAVVANNFSLSF